MKCSGCGADYSARLPKCPYCGTVNEAALRREKDKEKRRQLLRRFRLRTLREAGPRITIQVLNRLIIALVVIGALVFGAIFLVFFLEESQRASRKESASLAEHAAELEQLKENEDFAGIGQYLSEHSLSMYDEGMEEYWQLYEAYRDTRNFWEAADETERLSSEEAASDTWRYESLARAALSLSAYRNSQYEWDLLLEGNEAQYQKWEEELHLYLRLHFSMTEEELDRWLASPEDSYELEEEFGQFLKERAADHGR